MRGRSGQAELEIPLPSSISTMCACVPAAAPGGGRNLPIVGHRDAEAAEHTWPAIADLQGDGGVVGRNVGRVIRSKHASDGVAPSAVEPDLYRSGLDDIRHHR